jgi:hypothetical protein
LGGNELQILRRAECRKQTDGHLASVLRLSSTF